VRPTALSIVNLQVVFRTGRDRLHVVDEVSLDLAAGEHTALLGETGCGKSVLAAAVFRLLPDTAEVSGQVAGLGHKNLLGLSSRALNRLRGREMVLIPQNPHGSLNPVFRIRTQLAESLRLNRDRAGGGRRVFPEELLACVGFGEPASVASRFPHQLSGGMAQRVLAAAALAGAPSIVFADEPTKGLDEKARDQCLALLHSRFRECCLLLITHDLKAASECHRVVVMYAGEIVEVCPGPDLISSPRHPYRKGLVGAHPAHGLRPIPGWAPSPRNIPEGCRLHPRCERADERCRSLHPPLGPLSSIRSARCFHADA
jgi:peptide/nickel transport system ATP-binding protein